MPKKKAETVAKDADPGYVASLKNDSEGVAEKTKEPEIELVEELIRYEFTDDELLMLGSSLAGLMQTVERIRAEAKSAASSYKSDIEKTELDIKEVVTGLRDKFEMRRVDCYVVKDYRERKAYYLRADRYTLEFLIPFQEAISQSVGKGHIEPVKIRDLKSWELQAQLPFDEGPADD